MSWYKDRQEQKAREAGFIITDSSSVGAAAWKAGMVGYMSVRSSLQDVADDMEESGFWTGITNMFTNASEESMPAIVAAHNAYVTEFRKAKQNPRDAGRFNVAIRNPDKPHQGAMDHAWRYVEFQYPPNTPPRVKNSAGKWVDKVYPRTESWGAFPEQAQTPQEPAPTRGPVSIPGPGPKVWGSPSAAPAAPAAPNYLPLALGALAVIFIIRGA
jgi:hypothetical protein